MKVISQIPGCLAIVKMDEHHYQLNDTSSPSIGLCLGVFPSDEAARSFADKMAKIRALKPAGYLREQLNDHLHGELRQMGDQFKPAVSATYSTSPASIN